ncbi:MAG: trypsin-like serine protease [Ornithinimicrobium sp.]|uniref:trypsin-like serine protease n=1 Tax=Ornithinimicrobium sp. TaxID=1977084 RepID=UPI0026DEC943|nr:trypsin-like serine protease [Ornithinimicrobium sp.]MDO5739777.1 trypsin-like serine protease [Ornithinimicrobium sp.]
MRKTTILAGMTGLVMVAATAGPASAIKYGEPDNGEHPSVGLMLAYVKDDAGELVAGWRCTGTQMDADTFLTAGHCTDGADAVAIWYGDDLRDVQSAREFLSYDQAIDQESPFAADAWSTTVLTHPDFEYESFYLNDVGIVDKITLADGITFTQFGALPEESYWDVQLDTRKKDRDSYTTVGYGLQWAMPPSNGQGRMDQSEWTKLKAGGELIGNRQFNAGKANDAYVVLTNNANTGGTCSGDSGGPTFIEDTTTVVAVTSFGVNSTCAGTSGVYRIDTADDLAWLGGYIG